MADSMMFSLSPAFSVVARPQKQRPQRSEFHLKEPGSAITPLPSTSEIQPLMPESLPNIRLKMQP